MHSATTHSDESDRTHVWQQQKLTVSSLLQESIPLARVASRRHDASRPSCLGPPVAGGRARGGSGTGARGGSGAGARGGSLVDPQVGNREDGGRLAVLEGRMRALELENKYLRWKIPALKLPRTKSLKTCEDLRNSPYNETGTYTLDPDGSGAPVELYCDMEKGVTEVHQSLYARASPDRARPAGSPERDLVPGRWLLQPLPHLRRAHGAGPGAHRHVRHLRAADHL